MSLAPNWTDGDVVREVTRLHFSGSQPTLKLSSWEIPRDARALQVLVVKPTSKQPPAAHGLFLETVERALKPRTGTLLCKTADWRVAIDFVSACRAAGWTICEMVPTSGAPFAPHSYWICAHPGPRCRAEGIVLSITGNHRSRADYTSKTQEQAHG